MNDNDKFLLTEKVLWPDLFFEFILVTFFFKLQEKLTRTQLWEITRAFWGEARVRVMIDDVRIFGWCSYSVFQNENLSSA